MPPPSVTPPAAATWLPSGAAAYRRMLALINGATTSVRLETYIFRAAGIGARFRTALERAAARGVRVSVLVDGFGSSALPAAFWQTLEQAGGHVRVFNPLSFRRLGVRNHRKLLLVDDAAAVIGGFNIGDDYDGDGIDRGWRDLGIELHAPVYLRPLARSFDDLHAIPQFRRRFLRRLRQPQSRHAVTDAGAAMLLSGPGFARNPFRTTLYRALQHARRVEIVTAYFVPNFRLRLALKRVARRGGTVDLILAGQTDVPLTQVASRSVYGSLLRAGVRIHEYTPQVLHAKLAIVDGAVFVGSANLDPRSFEINYELMACIAEPSLVAEARQLFAADLGRSARIDLAAWRAGQHWVTRLHGAWARFLLTKFDRWLAFRQLRGLT